ncbi:chaperone protein dnaJ 11, chloroplastic [Artemisia annua]|uniref:Chaperone protein dnaJ 11, chloroplastic n=1 Tax=Artemisia annua TaxID=35608 RepID=A0A2U1QHN6_ARTAN|nr:chaperone protein dnaJ 11, chloroplastic [Artemisia annua]
MAKPYAFATSAAQPVYEEEVDETGVEPQDIDLVMKTKSSISAVHVAMPVMMKPASLYDVLRVERTATIPEIKKAYRNLAKVYHPDAGYEKNGDGEFIEIRNAYVTLSDPVAREIYDMKSRRRSTVVVSGERRGFYGSRRWETDQCW